MLLLDRQSGATAGPRGEANRPSDSAGQVQLRQRSDGRALDLAPGKTTIGSSPRCNIRIEQAGVHPLHCLIVEGPEGLRVRSWVGNTNLNGTPFEESALAIGDCLSVGSVELEVIDPRARMALPKEMEASAAESPDAEHIRGGRDLARTRSRQLLEALRQQRATHHELCQQFARLQESQLDAIAEQNEIRGKLENSLAELAVARLQMAEYQLVEAARQQLAERNELLSVEIGELSVKLNDLTSGQTQAAKDKRKLTDSYAALEQEYRQLIEANNRLQSEIVRLDNERAATDTQERDEKSKAISEAYEALTKEHNGLREESDQLREQIKHLTDERAAVEGAWQALSAEATTLSDSRQRVADDNATLVASLEEARQQLEREFDAAAEMRDLLARAREEAQHQLADAESRQVEQARRIQDLELQLAAAEERAANAAELAARPAAADWRTGRVEADRHATDETAWERPAIATDAWHSEATGVSTSDSVLEGTADSWLNASDAVAEEPNPWAEKVSAQTPMESSGFGVDDSTSLAQPPFEDRLADEQASVWNPAAAQPDMEFAEPVFAPPKESFQEESKPENDPSAKYEPASFIERYSHMFAEDGAASEEKPVRSNEFSQSRPIAPVVAPPAEAASTTKDEEEDSIEQYMAKLLQRVRGDSGSNKVVAAERSQMPLNAPMLAAAGHSDGHSASSTIMVSEAYSEGETNAIEELPTNLAEAAKRRLGSPAPATNLGALRALANETARQAISRHELRKLRRNAVTKTIVATLAGMTSLWLMLDSPNWRSVHFITACGALLIAAYWAGETFRTLLNSMRIAAHDGPEETALPIDIEERM